MMRSLSSGVAGLKSQQTAMDVIGNNIANVNTTGFKSSSTAFSDMLYQTTSGAAAPTDTTGGTNPVQVGLGARVASISLNFNDGNVDTTGVNTNLCLSGNGLFVVNKGKEEFYTRDGSFRFDGAGNYVNSEGLFVQGWMANNGSVNTSAEPGNIVIPAGSSIPPAATTMITYTKNLNAADVPIESVTGGKTSETEYTSSAQGSVEAVNTNTVMLRLANGNEVRGKIGQTYAVGGDYTDTLTEGSILYAPPSTNVKLNLKDGRTGVVPPTPGTYTVPGTYIEPTNTVGDAMTADDKSKLIVTVQDTVLYTGGKVLGDPGNTYTVGNDYVADFDTVGDSVTKNADNTLEVEFSDGSTTTVTAGSDTYIVGSPDPGGAPKTVKSIRYKSPITDLERRTSIVSIDVSSTVTKMVVSEPATGIKVYNAKEDGAAISTAKYPVKLTLADGGLETGDVGSTYTVGDDYLQIVTDTSETITASVDVPVDLKLLDGNVVTDLTSGAYKCDDIYNYTPTSVTYQPGLHTVTLTLANGGTKTLVGGDVYTVGATVVDDLSVTTTITGISVDSKIGSITKHNKITRMEQEYIAAASADQDHPVTVKMADGKTYTLSSGVYSVGSGMPLSTTFSVYDTLGNLYTVPLYFTKSSTGSGVSPEDGNHWTVQVSTDGSGKAKVGENATVEMGDVDLQFDPSGAYVSGAGKVTMTLNAGSQSPQTITIDLTQLTQYAGSNTVAADGDGNESGVLKEVVIDNNGVITGTYSNGLKRTEAQVAIAQFNNASGLTQVGSNRFQESNNSGTAKIGTAAALGTSITAGAVEMSNVDIAAEFSTMIRTQRAYQANSKIITVSDEMLETLINMKR